MFMSAWNPSTTEHRMYAERIAAHGEEDIAWFGGWLCADGSIGEHSNSRPSIRFVLTDADPLDRFAEMFGNTVHGPYAPSGLGRKPRYEWQISGWRASMILDRVRPWLSERYLARADAVADWQPRGHSGRKLLPEQVAKIKAELAIGKWGTTRRLAREYGVSEAAISAIKAGRIWGDIQPA